MGDENTENLEGLMKKVAILGVLLGVIAAFSFAAPVLAAQEASITITMEGPAISIDIGLDSEEWIISPVEKSTQYSQTFTLTNNSNVTVDTTISATNATGYGRTWPVGDLAGTNVYSILWNTGGANTIIYPNFSNNFIEDLAVGATQGFTLRLNTPNGDNFPAPTESLQATVTIRAVQG